jgi:enoyl-CoA hydratase/carnithine racemase
MNMGKRQLRLDRQGAIATLTFDWADKANTMGQDFAPQMLDALAEIERDKAIQAVVLTGSGKVFCGGGDLFEIMSPDRVPVEEDVLMVAGYNAVAERLYYLRGPVIAAVNGPAAGGGAGVAMACDFAIAAPSARYDIAFARLGLSGADVGVPWLLAHHLGPGRANYYMYTAGSIDAATGLGLGLFVEVVAAPDLLARAQELALQITQNYTPLTLGITKTAMRHGSRMELRANLAYEAYLQAVAFQAAGHKESVERYRQKVLKKGSGK